VSQYQKGKTNLDFTETRDSEWQWHQLAHMQVCTLLQTDNHTSTPPLSFLQAGCPSCRPTNSVKALKATYSVMKKKRKGCGGKDLQKRKVLSLEWKSEWVTENVGNAQEFVSSSIGQGTAESRLRASCSHPCAPIAKQYNFFRLLDFFATPSQALRAKRLFGEPSDNRFALCVHVYSGLYLSRGWGLNPRENF